MASGLSVELHNCAYAMRVQASESAFLSPSLINVGTKINPIRPYDRPRFIFDTNLLEESNIFKLTKNSASTNRAGLKINGRC